MSCPGFRVTAPVGVDANASVASLFAQPRAHASRSKCPANAPLVATGPDLDVKAVLTALRLAAAKPSVKRAHRDKKSLSPSDVAAVSAAADAAGAPLPPGWAFDGATYASFDGARTKLRPDVDALVDAHLAKLNAAIDRDNAKMAA